MANTSTDLDAEVQRLKDRRAAAISKRVRAEHDRDAAQAQADRLRSQLQAEFGVSTVAEAQALHTELQGELNTTIAGLRQGLDDIGV